jgi:hypothetical protein
MPQHDVSVDLQTNGSEFRVVVSVDGERRAEFDAEGRAEADRIADDIVKMAVESGGTEV